MATASARKNGHELAAAWLCRDNRPAQDALRRRPGPQPAPPSDEDGATAQAVFQCDRTRGFFRA